MGKRWFFHFDFNHFYAQSELFRHPELRGVPIAVCGSKEDRHGIVLTKCLLAKKAGVKTAMAIWEAKQLCPDLQIVEPHMDEYREISDRVLAIYGRYTDRVERYGLDECFLEVTKALHLFGDDPYKLACKIREDVRRELGMTVSIGIGFSKKLAKLGSDISGVNEILYITPDNYKKIVWPLPIQELIFIGKKTTIKLNGMGIRTLGDLANANPVIIQQKLGVRGMEHWFCVNGMESTDVSPVGYERPIKSVSRGTTCRQDLRNNDELSKIAVYLAQKVARELREKELKAREISIELYYMISGFMAGKVFKCRVSYPTYSWKVIHETVMQLMREYSWWQPVRKIVVRTAELVDAGAARQINMFDFVEENIRLEKREKAFFDIRGRFGDSAICTLAQMFPNKLPRSEEYMKMKLPEPFYR